MKDYLREQLKEMPPHRAILRAVECRLMAQVPLTPPVLDVGCGDGHFASVAYDRLPLEVGIDPATSALAESRSRTSVYRHLVQSSAEALPFAEGAFGTVVSNCVIEHVPDLEACLREIHRVLIPRGLFATTVPSEHYADFLLGSTVLRKMSLGGVAQRYGRFFNRISRHFHVYPADRWVEKLECAGFAVERQVDYFSAAAHRRFDLSHYIGVPHLLTKRLFGSWISFPLQAKIYERWLRPYYEEPYPEAGAYRFFVCTKRDDSSRVDGSATSSR